MKKIIIAVLLVMLVTGCGEKEIKEEKVLNLNNAVKEIEKIEIDGKKIYSDKDAINDLDLIEGYGLDVKLLDEYYIYLSSSVEDPSMYMIVKPKENQKSVVDFQIKELFENYEAAYMGYYPEIAGMISNRETFSDSGYQIYIVSKDNKLVKNTILASKE